MAGAGRRTFAAGELLTSSNVQNYLMDQAVMVFSSAAARTSAIAVPTEGMTSYLTDQDQLYIYDGSAWQSVVDISAWTAYTPTITASTTNPTFTYTTQQGAYMQIGKTVHFRMNLVLNVVTSAGTGNYLFDLPVAGVAGVVQSFYGRYYDTSTGLNYRIMGTNASSTNKISTAWYSDGAATFVSATTPVAPATGDIYSFAGTYEVA